MPIRNNLGEIGTKLKPSRDKKSTQNLKEITKEINQNESKIGLGSVLGILGAS